MKVKKKHKQQNVYYSNLKQDNITCEGLSIRDCKFYKCEDNVQALDVADKKKKKKKFKQYNRCIQCSLDIPDQDPEQEGPESINIEVIYDKTSGVFDSIKFGDFTIQMYYEKRTKEGKKAHLCD